MPTPLEDKALAAQLHLKQLARQSQVNFLGIGEVLCDVQDNAYWSVFGCESLKSFIEEAEIGFSYSFSTRLMGFHRYFILEGYNPEYIAEIGVTKLSLLLPLVRKTIEEWVCEDCHYVDKSP